MCARVFVRTHMSYSSRSKMNKKIRRRKKLTTWKVEHKLRKSHTHRHILRVFYSVLSVLCMHVYFKGILFRRLPLSSYKKIKMKKKNTISRQYVLVCVFCKLFHMCVCAALYSYRFVYRLHPIRCCHFTALVKRRLSNHFARFFLFSFRLLRFFSFVL